MSLRLARTLGAACLALVLGAGCMAPPEMDPDWRAMADATPEERMLFARARRVEARDAINTSRVAAGLGALITAYAGIAHLQSESWNRDQDGGIERMKNRMGAVAVGAALLTAVAVVFGGYHEVAYDRWGTVGRIEAERQAALDSEVHWTGEPAPPLPGPPPPARLYLAHGTPVPAGAAGMEIVRVSGPEDSALAELTAAIGAVQLPVLQVRSTDGPLYVIGPDAVGKSLATRSSGR